MKQKKCTVCTRVKGKRVCLLKDKTLICSRCCAEIRTSDCEGCAYYQQSQQFALEKAKKSPKHFVARMSPEVDDQIDHALSIAESGNIKAAEKLLNDLKADNDDLYTLHYAIGTLHALKQEFDEAIISFDTALEIYPFFTECWFNRAVVAQRKLNIEQMLISLNKVIELGSPNDEVVMDAKDLLKKAAQGIYEESGLDVPSYIESMQLFNRSFELMEKQEWAKALMGFEKVIRINPTSEQTLGNIAICYMNLKENDKAIEFFDKAIALNPEYEPALINREILKFRIEENITEDIPIKSIEYNKDYALEDKPLIEDYIENKL